MQALFSFNAAQNLKGVVDVVSLFATAMSKPLAKVLLVIITVLTILAAWSASTLRFDYEFEHFFPTEDPMLDFYQDFKDKFYTDVDFVLLGLRNEEGR